MQNQFCTECGARLDENGICPHCAAAAQEQPAAPAQQTAPAYHSAPAQQTEFERPFQGSEYEPVTTGGFVGISLLLMIPVVNLILLIVWACGGCRKRNKRNYARAMLILTLISLVLAVAFAIFAYFYWGGLEGAREALTQYAQVLEQV